MLFELEGKKEDKTSGKTVPLSLLAHIEEWLFSSSPVPEIQLELITSAASFETVLLYDCSEIG